MALNLHPKFLAGRYADTAEALLGQKAALRKSGNFVSLVAALSFLGRLEEAADLLDEYKAKFRGLPIVAARFYLAIGWIRRSEYDKAKSIFAANRKLAGKTELEQFFLHQGNVLYLYYTGQPARALAEAELALRYATKAGDLLARALATDALGHCNVVGGEIHKGLAQLAEAARLMVRLGNKSFANGFAISKELYEAEFGLTGAAGIERLEKRLESTGTEDNYSAANVAMELARQYTLRGKFNCARRALELAAPSIYANQHRRHEIRLNLRLAELAGRQGDFFQAKHYLWFARRLLNREADASFELELLGIERKLALAEGNKADADRLDHRWDQLSRTHSSTRDANLRARAGRGIKANPEDKIHTALVQSALGATLEARLAPLLEQGFLAEASRELGLNPSANAVAVLANGLLIQSRTEITWIETALSSLQYKLLKVIGGNLETSKESLVELVWGYRYDPLRHDSMVYAAISSLRKALGPAAAWVEASEGGYRFSGTLYWRVQPMETAPAEPPKVAAESLAHLNHRQIEILEWLRANRYLGVAECKVKFGVSEITALRDLDGLRKNNYVLRIGKARATRYLLRPEGDTQ
jgi:DNA-binding winged helix-turn-helix (wHTH) protein